MHIIMRSDLRHALQNEFARLGFEAKPLGVPVREESVAMGLLSRNAFLFRLQSQPARSNVEVARLCDMRAHRKREFCPIPFSRAGRKRNWRGVFFCREKPVYGLESHGLAGIALRGTPRTQPQISAIKTAKGKFCLLDLYAFFCLGREGGGRGIGIGEPFSQTKPDQQKKHGCQDPAYAHAFFQCAARSRRKQS